MVREYTYVMVEEVGVYVCMDGLTNHI